MKNKKALVTGAGGFIGHHMVSYLKDKGFWVRGVDIKRPEYEKSKADDFQLLDLRERDEACKAVEDIDYVFNFAANMGGIGFIESVHADIMRDNSRIIINMLEESYQKGVERFFFPSSACVYPESKQEETGNPGLREEDAYPAEPDTAYGWEKIYAEELCKAYYEDYKLETRIARFHNIYGPLGSWYGGREKSPAALSRKVAMADDGDSIIVWGDGEQERSYCYIKDCVEGVYKLTMSDIRQPLNIGSDRLVTINELIDMIAGIAGKEINKEYDLDKPQGVRSRNSDNTLTKRLLQWEPSVSLEKGIEKTYNWIKNQIEEKNYNPKLLDTS